MAVLDHSFDGAFHHKMHVPALEPHGAAVPLRLDNVRAAAQAQHDTELKRLDKKHADAGRRKPESHVLQLL